MIKQRINDDIKRSMKENKPMVRDALRFLKSKIQQKEIDSKKDLIDEDCIQIIKTLVKQNNESLEYNPKNTEQIKLEITIWNYYLPKQLTESETKDAMLLIAKTNNLTEQKQIGRLLGTLRKQLGGTVDMTLASELAKEILI